MTDDGPAIDGDLLDRLEAELRDRVGRERAITSGELADRITAEDAEANPKTREAIKELMRERNLPVVAGNTGYYIPASDDRVEEYLDGLEGRIAGIRERERALREAWDGWDPNPDPDPDPPRTDGGPASDAATYDSVEDIPAEVREQIEADQFLTPADFVDGNGGGEA